MIKLIRKPKIEVDIETHAVEWGVEIVDDFTGERFVAEMDSEDTAREAARAMAEPVKVREIFETAWADAPDA